MLLLSLLSSWLLLLLLCVWFEEGRQKGWQIINLLKAVAVNCCERRHTKLVYEQSDVLFPSLAHDFISIMYADCRSFAMNDYTARQGNMAIQVWLRISRALKAPWKEPSFRCLMIEEEVDSWKIQIWFDSKKKERWLLERIFHVTKEWLMEMFLYFLSIGREMKHCCLRRVLLQS